jgi:uncharacterized protein
VRDDLIRRRLAESNPWWSAGSPADVSSAWVRHDLLLTARGNFDIGYRSDILADIATAPIGDSLTVLQGPRRVGKSVVVRELAAALCTRPDVDARQVVSLACDGMTAQDITRAIKLGRELTRSVDQPEARRRVWLFDEITPIKGWATAVKHARDNSAFGLDTVVTTGSSWRAEEDVEGNLFAGRSGTAGLRRLRHLMPMSFRDYVVTVRRSLPVPDVIHPTLLQSSQARLALETMRFAIDDFDLAWQAYLASGGFPRAIHAVETTGAHDRGYLEDLHAWLRRDVDPDGPQESILLLLDAIAARSSSPFDRAGTAEALGYASKNTFDRRLARLVASYGALWCPQRNEKGRTVPSTQAKLYLTDPVLAWIPNLLRAGAEPPDFTRLTEQTIGVGLARSIDDHESGRWIAADTIGYSRTSTGNEVDLAPVNVATPGGPRSTTPIESKWVDNGWRREALTIEGKFARGVVATKTILDFDSPSWGIPAPLLMMLVGP